MIDIRVNLIHVFTILVSSSLVVTFFKDFFELQKKFCFLNGPDSPPLNGTTTKRTTFFAVSLTLLHSVACEIKQGCGSGSFGHIHGFRLDGCSVSNIRLISTI